MFVRTSGSVDNVKELPLIVLFRVGLGVLPL